MIADAAVVTEVEAFLGRRTQMYDDHSLNTASKMILSYMFLFLSVTKISIS